VHLFVVVFFAAAATYFFYLLRKCECVISPLSTVSHPWLPLFLFLSTPLYVPHLVCATALMIFDALFYTATSARFIMMMVV